MIEASLALTIEAALEAALPTESAFDAAVDTMLTALDTTLIAWDSTLIAWDSAEAACALTAESSVDVTLPAPPPAALILFDRALMTLCSPCVDTPADRAEIPERKVLTDATRLDS